MSRVTANVFANFAGSFWGAVISLFFVPIYIRYLGMEAYGLIGISSAITVIMSLSDFGITAALMREMARGWKTEEDINEGRQVFAILSRLYFPLVMLLGGAIVVSAPYIASDWIKAGMLETEVVVMTLRIIGIMASLQLLAVYFSAALLGLQRQVLANIIGMVTATVQALGAVLVLEFYGPDIVAFFAWQTLVLGISAAVTAVAVNSIVPRAVKRGDIDRSVFRRVIRFALGMSGISVLSIVLTQTDKVVLSKLLSLEQFGYYSLATVVAMSLKRLFGPLFSAFYPRLIELVRRNDPATLSHVYHLASQAMGAMVLPVSMLLMFYSWEIVYVWTGDVSIADRSHMLITILVAGTALTGLTQTPYALQLAHGKTRLALIINIVGAIFFVPAVYLLGKYYGGEGAATAWLILNLAYILVYVPLAHKQILLHSLRRWYVRDTLIPGLAAAGPLLVALPLVRAIEGERISLFLIIAVAYLVSVAMAVLVARDLRDEIWRRIMSKVVSA